MMTTDDQTYVSRVLLVTDPALYPVLAKTILMAHPLATPRTLMLAKPIVDVIPFHTQSALESYCDEHKADLEDARLLTCGTDVIVPDAVLSKFSEPSYNVHPGLPEYPGRYPSVFAIYDGAKEFGTTVHELVQKVDSGPIVAIDRFPMPENPERSGLEMLSLQSVLNTIGALTPAFLTRGALQPLGVAWTGTAKRQCDFDALCKLPKDVDQTEFYRRWRAVGEGPDHALEIELFGHRFRLDNQRESGVTIAGQQAVSMSPEGQEG